MRLSAQDSLVAPTPAASTMSVPSPATEDLLEVEYHLEIESLFPNRTIDQERSPLSNVERISLTGGEMQRSESSLASGSVVSVGQYTPL